MTTPTATRHISLLVAGRAGEGVISRRSVPMDGAVELAVYSPQASAAVKPGQFFQIAVGAPNTLLRRPYSAAWSNAATGELGFIFNVVGSGSGWLAGRGQGDSLELLGPLGRGFDLDGDGPAVCVAGGLGTAVFPGVVQALLERRRPVTVLHGARTATQLMPAERFRGADVRFATDDGTMGHRGSVVDLLSALPPVYEGGRELFCCGPTPMLRSLVEQAGRLKIPRSWMQIALETPMGCGIGTCLACVAPGADGKYLLTCQQGPCVRADQLDWDRMTDVFHG